MKRFIEQYLLVTLMICGFSLKGQTSKVEKEALIAIYNQTSGEKWAVTWDLTKSETTWQGVVIENGQ